MIENREGLTFHPASQYPKCPRDEQGSKCSENFQSIASWASFDLQQEQALSITFKIPLLKKYIQRCIWIREFNGSKIYFRTDKSSVFQTQNDLYILI